MNRPRCHICLILEKKVLTLIAERTIAAPKLALEERRVGFKLGRIKIEESTLLEYILN